MAKLSRDEIFDKVRTALVETLSVEEDEVTEKATLKGDLDAESIDMLDLLFRLEKMFGVKISQDELISKEFLSDARYVSDKRLNATGLTQLRQLVPHGNFAEFEKNPAVDNVLDVFTVGTIVSFVEQKLAKAG